VVLIVLFIGVGLLSHLPKMLINSVSVSGTKVLDETDVGKQTLAYLDGNTALFYARGNIFIYSKSDLVQFIEATFPRVYKVIDIARDGRKLAINLEERKAAFTWCGTEAPVYESRFEKRDCFFLDQTGFIFDASPYFTPGVYLTFYGGINSDAPVIGQTLTVRNSIVEFGELATSLAHEHLPVHSVVIHSDGQNELLLDIFTSTADYARILFNEDHGLDDISSKISSAVNEESFINAFTDNGAQLEYIDTRFDNRVFYKFKEI
jgi:hypothetical protein